MSKLSLFVEAYDTDPAGNPLAMGGVADLVDASPNVIKIMGSGVQVHWAHHRDPDILYILRDMARLEDSVPEGSQPSRALAEQLYPHFKSVMKEQPYAYHELWPNEPGRLEDSAALAALGDYWARLAELAAGDGLRVCIGNFSAEANLADKWQPFRPALEACAKFGHILSLHGYYSPRLDSPGCEPFLFPHRALKAALSAAGIAMPRVVLTEFGVDSILSQGKSFNGWKTVPGSTPQGYMAQLAWADGELARDPEVIGACVYIYLRNADEEDKVNYNVAFGEGPSRRNPEGVPAVADLLLAHIRANPAPPPLPAPNPVPPPPAPVPNPAPLPRPSEPYPAVLTANLNARLGDQSTGRLLATLPAGTRVRVIQGGSPVPGQAPRAAIQVTVLEEFLKPD
jgi:hypothetical protein